MPLIVDEVVISVEVGNAPAGGGGEARSKSTAGSTNDRQALVAECVERVLEVLRDREER